MNRPTARVLLDECVPRRFQRELPGLAVSHVVSEGWAGKRNGELLGLMREGGFTVLVTVDRNLAFQQNVAASGLAVLVLHSRSNRVQDLKPLVPALLEAIVSALPGQVTRVGI
ncbi:MAG TPA: hypothetical protein VFK16_03600 [Gemmatimonadaceae bacterium]|nr:hypothetical protein [Gemmatimonadaceae bacterium]